MASDNLVAIRKRFFEEFDFWAKWACKIRTKQGEILPLVLNPVQARFNKQIEDQLRTTGKVRAIILKARQQGLSTYVSSWSYWWLSQHAAQKGLVATHVADSTRALFDMYQRIHDNVPEMLKPSTKYSSRQELKFDKLDSGIMIATAGAKGVARGETLTVAHLSELAFWPPATANDNLNAIFQAIPDTPGTAVFIESTANGLSGPFAEIWRGAVAGENGFIPFFSAWFESPEYRVTVEKDFELTLEEEDLVKEFGLDKEQLLFRRQKIAQNGLDMFKQEYPATPEEAFISSGRPVFNPDQINELLKYAPEPLYRMAVEKGSVEKHPRGELLVYREREDSENYTIGADVSIGVRDKKSDFSVAQILDSKKRQVAVWRGQAHPDYFAVILEALGYYYHTAMIAPERNAHGLLTAVKLGRDLMYPKVFTDITEGQLSDRDSINIGFLTTSKTKPLIIDRLRASLRENEITLYDKTTLNELLSFVVWENGDMKAEEGCHDDCVMALAICNHVHEGYFTPIEVTDEFYVPAL
jgi:hypothetical protein